MIHRCEVAIETKNLPRLTEVFIQKCGKPANLYADRHRPFGIALCEEHQEWGK